MISDPMIPKAFHIEVAGVARELPVREVAPGVHLGILLLACDPELTEAAGRALAAKMPADVDVLVMPDSKAQGLLHVVQRESQKPAVLIRKERKSYLVEPVHEVTARSVTTTRLHTFYLGADDAASLQDKVVAILDDVVSSGGTVHALQQLLGHCGVRKTYVLAVGTEGQPRADVIALTHLEVFTC
jgi:adenine phosphoribosyltransferase